MSDMPTQDDDTWRWWETQHETIVPHEFLLSTCAATRVHLRLKVQASNWYGDLSHSDTTAAQPSCKLLMRLPTNWADREQTSCQSPDPL
jgi:hypothetical protein